MRVGVTWKPHACFNYQHQSLHASCGMRRAAGMTGPINIQGRHSICSHLSRDHLL
jgi:hypothetical protein